MGEKTKVFFLPWERRKELPRLLERSGMSSVLRENDFVAVKTHFGEKGNDGYIRPEYIHPILNMVREKKAKAFLTDTNTIYSGQRNNAVNHLAIAAEHGFSFADMGVPVIIADGLLGDDYEEVEIEGRHFSRVKIGSAIRHADAIIAISHVKGHLMAGFGGAIKNLGMGCGAKIGKFEMHSSAAPTLSIKLCTGCGACVARCNHGALSIVKDKVQFDEKSCRGCGECVIACNFGALSISWDKGARDVQERFAEYAKGTIEGKRAFFINFINHVTPNCDCQSRGEKPLLPDVGILASEDPVAIDQASVDLIIGRAGDVFAKAHKGIDWSVQLAHAEKMGLGRRVYELVELESS